MWGLKSIQEKENKCRDLRYSSVLVSFKNVPALHDVGARACGCSAVDLTQGEAKRVESGKVEDGAVVQGADRC